MGRTTPLTAAAMLGLALLAPTTSASAAGEGGRDLTNGGPGRDRCVAERERKCER